MAKQETATVGQAQAQRILRRFEGTATIYVVCYCGDSVDLRTDRNVCGCGLIFNYSGVAR